MILNEIIDNNKSIGFIKWEDSRKAEMVTNLVVHN